jgi:hypothetical protein
MNTRSFHIGPPRAMQKVDSVLFTEFVHRAPIVLRHSEPLAVPWPDVNVDGAEVVILLVGGVPRTRHLHRHLHSVHPQQWVTCHIQNKDDLSWCSE